MRKMARSKYSYNERKPNALSVLLSHDWSELCYARNPLQYYSSPYEVPYLTLGGTISHTCLCHDIVYVTTHATVKTLQNYWMPIVDWLVLRQKSASIQFYNAWTLLLFRQAASFFNLLAQNTTTSYSLMHTILLNIHIPKWFTTCLHTHISCW